MLRTVLVSFYALGFAVFIVNVLVDTHDEAAAAMSVVAFRLGGIMALVGMAVLWLWLRARTAHKR